MTILIRQLPLFALQAFLCLLVADFLSGLFHWLEDTYATNRWPRFLQRWIVDDNIGHHRTPAKFTRGSWWTRNHLLVVASAAVAVVAAAFGIHDWRVFFTLAVASQSNEIHSWAHRRNVHWIVTLLQRTGILQSRRHHGEHHRSPYALRFCTTTNFLNPILDTVRFWRTLEAVTEFLIGVSPKRVTELRGGY